MDLLMLRSQWTGPPSLEDLVTQAVTDGFDGIEGPIPQSVAEQHRYKKLLANHGLAFIAESTTGGDFSSPSDWWIPRPDRTIADHLSDLQWTVDRAADMGALFVSTMCGYDAWSWSQNVDFFGQALALEKQSGITISFETHRGRSLFNPWITRDLLNEFPQMKLTCDFSHWCVVCERLIDSEWSILELCAERAMHVQCRVGYSQHAQVSDPRAPEYAEALTAHERWWELIWQKQAERGMKQTTMMPEFLWDGYMQTLPHTGMPGADVWEITCWMAQRQRRRFMAQD
ncbi:MAG: sugar phosphate isomerase/epimerase family protein [Thermosynechococcaceae cyanobacterium]